MHVFVSCDENPFNYPHPECLERTPLFAESHKSPTVSRQGQPLHARVTFESTNTLQYGANGTEETTTTTTSEQGCLPVLFFTFLLTVSGVVCYYFSAQICSFQSFTECSVEAQTAIGESKAEK